MRHMISIIKLEQNTDYKLVQEINRVGQNMKGISSSKSICFKSLNENKT